mgnify:CR=1 FL=1
MKISALNYDISWERIVSDILSPPMVWALMAVPIALRDSPTTSQGIEWASIYIWFVCISPLIYIGIMVKRGRITDMHMKVRGERIKPFLVSIASTLIAFFVLTLSNASDVVLLFTLFTLVQLILIAGITLKWQISFHAISIGGATVALWVLFSTLYGMLTLPLVIVVGAARLRLHRHTPAQVVAGSILGMLVPVLLFAIFA